MQDANEEPFPIPRILLIGSGTVFGTYLFVLAMTLVGAAAGPEYGSSSSQNVGLFLVYAFVGFIIASCIILIGAIPLLLLWKAVFRYLGRLGLSQRRAAIWTSGVLAYATTVFVIIFAEMIEFIRLPAVAWLFVLVPVALASGLAALLFGNKGKAA